MKYSIKNFRVFDSEGVTLDIAPITILTGCNSSGKSSIAKSLLLLDSFLSPIKENIQQGHDVNLNDSKIDFNKRPYSLLGNFEKVLNRYSKDCLITFEYEMYSPLIKEEVIVRLKFGKDLNDELGDAFLKELCVLDKEGEIIYTNLGVSWEFFCSRFYTFLSENNGNNSNLPGTSGKLISAIKKLPSTVVEKSQRYNSLYAFNLFEWLGECTCDNLKEAIYSHINADRPKNVKFSNELKDAIEILVQDFTKSDYDSFIEYFQSMEKMYLANMSHSESISKSFIDFNKYCNTEGILPFIPKLPNRVKDKLKDNGITERDIQDMDSEFYNNLLGNYILSFRELYTLLCEIETATKKRSDTPFYFTELFYVTELSDVDACPIRIHYAANVFKHYSRLFIEQLFQPYFLGMSYVGSSRVDVRRMYTLEDNNDFALLLKRYFEAKRHFSAIYESYRKAYDSLGISYEKLDYASIGEVTPGDFINKWLSKFGIADHVSIRKENDGVVIYLYDDKEETYCELLADKGYGITQLVSVLLEIETKILVYNRLSEELPKPSLIVIEEPEIHLHPNYQSLLADMFLEAYQKYNIHFIIETHSEYLIRRTQVISSEQRYESQEELNEKNPFRVYYITKDSQLYDMRYRTNGLFAEKFGEGFMDEASKMHMTLLKNDRR